MKIITSNSKVGDLALVGGLPKTTPSTLEDNTRHGFSIRLVDVLSSSKQIRNITNKYGPYKANRIITFIIPGRFNGSIELYTPNQITIKWWTTDPQLPTIGSQDLENEREVMIWLYTAIGQYLPKSTDIYLSLLQEI